MRGPQGNMRSRAGLRLIALITAGMLAALLAGLVTGTAAPTVTPVSAAALTAVTISVTGPANPAPNQPVNFSASATTPNAGAGIASFQFSFGDGTVITAPPTPAGAMTASASATHVYSTANTFLASVTATDSTGATGSNSTNVTVKVSAQSLVVSLTAQPAAAAVGQPVNFSFTATTPNTGSTIQNVSINFGDGTPAMTQAAASGTVPHTYFVAGTFNASLTATDSAGNLGQTSAEAFVGTGGAFAGGNPQNGGLVFFAAPSGGAIGTPVTFTAGPANGLPCGNLGSFTYNFGDGSVVTGGPTVTHTFMSPGDFTVSVTGTCNGVSTSGTTSFLAQSGVGTTYGAVNGSTYGAVNGTVPVTYQPGWNIVAGPAGSIITGNQGPLYTFRPGDVAYEVVPTGTGLQSGIGYWAYFSTVTTVMLPFANGSMTANLPPSQYVMVGDPDTATGTISGADYVVTWSPTANNYVPTNQVSSGQGAWAFSFNGGVATIGP